MKIKMKYITRLSMALAGIMTLFSLTGCEDTKSYSELLKEETEAVNWYLASNKIVTSVPEDSIFIEGADTPFYRMNGDGTVYMRVINPGDKNKRPKKGDTVFFRFMRKNIKYLYEGMTVEGEGNADNMNSALNGTSLVYGNTVLTSTTQYGEGLQVPLGYLGYDCEVDLIVKSTMGFTSDVSNCIPYIYNVRYFKAEY